MTLSRFPRRCFALLKWKSLYINYILMICDYIYIISFHCVEIIYKSRSEHFSKKSMCWNIALIYIWLRVIHNSHMFHAYSLHTNLNTMRSFCCSLFTAHSSSTKSLKNFNYRRSTSTIAELWYRNRQPKLAIHALHIVYVRRT